MYNSYLTQYIVKVIIHVSRYFIYPCMGGRVQQLRSSHMLNKWGEKNRNASLQSQNSQMTCTQKTASLQIYNNKSVKYESNRKTVQKNKWSFRGNLNYIQSYQTCYYSTITQWWGPLPAGAPPPPWRHTEDKHLTGLVGWLTLQGTEWETVAVLFFWAVWAELDSLLPTWSRALKCTWNPLERLNYSVCLLWLHNEQAVHTQSMM